MKVHKAYGRKVVLDNISLSFLRGARIGVIGSNGSGKTTLLRVLAGVETEFDGERWADEKCSIGYLAQEPELTPGTVRENIDEAVADIRGLEDELGDVYAKMGDADEKEMERLYKRVAELEHQIEITDAYNIDHKIEQAAHALGCPPMDRDVGPLSGGERRRVALCKLLLRHPDILLLDEPTNHLDVDAREALAHALNAYEGAVVLVSHDPHLVEIVADELWLVEDGGCKRFDGDLGDYRRHLIERTRTAKRARNGDAPATSRKDERRARARAREATADLRKRAKEAEKWLERLGRQRAEIETVLADPSTYEGSTADMLELGRKLAKIDDEIAAAESAWLEAEEALGR